MLTVLVDECIDGYASDLTRLANEEVWSDFRTHLGLVFKRFRDVGLAHSTPDNAIWQFVQFHRYVLITDNRNQDGPTSLGITIRNSTDENSTPVLTIGNMDRFVSDPEYARDVIEQLYIYLLDLNTFLGTGRLFLP